MGPLYREQTASAPLYDNRRRKKEEEDFSEEREIKRRTGDDRKNGEMRTKRSRERADSSATSTSSSRSSSNSSVERTPRKPGRKSVEWEGKQEMGKRPKKGKEGSYGRTESENTPLHHHRRHRHHHTVELKPLVEVGTQTSKPAAEVLSSPIFAVQPQPEPMLQSFTSDLESVEMNAEA